MLINLVSHEIFSFDVVIPQIEIKQTICITAEQ